MGSTRAHFSVRYPDIQKINAFRFLITPESISLPYYSVRNIGLSRRAAALTLDYEIFSLNIRGGEPTNNECTSQKRGSCFVGNHSSEDLLLSERIFETNYQKKQRKLSLTADSKTEPANEASVPLVQMEESEANDTRPLSPFDGGPVSSSIVLLKSTSTIATASNLLCNNLLNDFKAVHFAVAAILSSAVSTCVIAVLVHAVMSTELFSAFNEGWSQKLDGGPQGYAMPLNLEGLLVMLANFVSSAGLCSGYLLFPVPLCDPEYFPYGCTTFTKIRKEKRYWKDNSRHIAITVEKMEDHVMFLRPPRWGKSLFLDMLKCYLDIKEADRFDMMFGGTEIYSMKNKLRCRNRYYVMRFDFSIAVEDGDLAVIKHRLAERIQQAVDSFRRRYGLDYDVHPGNSALNNVVSAILYVQEALGGDVFVLIDEYDRFASKIMFENTYLYSQVVTGQSGDPLSSPIRSFFETIKMMTNIRSFTVGINPIALADSSGANFIADISAYVGDVVGLTDADVRSALTSIFGDKCSEIDSLMLLIQRFYNGFRFGRKGIAALTPPLYHTQLCIYFFRKLCCSFEFRRKAFAGTVTISDMTDQNTKVSENVINLLIRQSEFAGLVSKLYSEGSVAANTVSSFKLRDILSETPSSDLLVSFMTWHGLLTKSCCEVYKIPNQVVGDAGEILRSVVEAMDTWTHKVLPVIIEPSAAQVWSMNCNIFSTMGTRFDNSISEAALVGFAEVSLQIQGKREHFEVICEGRTFGRKRCDLILVDRVSCSFLIVKYKRLRPGGGDYAQDLALWGKPVHLVLALNVQAANDQLLKLEIAESKRCFHNNAATVRALLVHAKEQVLAYARELCSRPEYAGYKCNTAVVIHATSKIGTGSTEEFCSVLGAWVQDPMETAPRRPPAVLQ